MLGHGRALFARDRVAGPYRAATVPTMRLPAPLALLVAAGLLLLAAPSAGAAIAYAPCSAGSALQCGSLDVPLDRSGAVPGAIRLAAARRVAPSNPTNTARARPRRRPRPGRRSRSSPTSPSSWPRARDARPAHVRPARHGQTRATCAARWSGNSLTRRRPALRQRARRAPRPLHDRRERRGHRGGPRQQRLRQARHLRRLVRDEGRARLRRALSDPRRRAHPRLRRPAARPRPAAALDVRRDAPRAYAALRRRRVQRHLRQPDGRPRQPRAQPRAQAAARPADERSRRAPARRDPPLGPLRRHAHRRREPDAARRAAGRADVRAQGRLRAADPARRALGGDHQLPERPTSEFSDAVFAATLCEEGNFPWNRAAQRHRPRPADQRSPRALPARPRSARSTARPR